MKLNVISTSLILISLFVFSCSTEDSFENPTINGNWYLKNYEHSTNGENINYVENDIIWNFNENLNKLTVELNFSATTLENYESLYIGLSEGVYDYSIVEENNILYLMVGDYEFGNVLFSTNELIINRRESPYGTGNNLSTWNFEK